MASGSACARAALVGNPSDLYGGAVLGVPVRELVATVEITDGAPEAPPIVAAAGVTRAHVATTIPQSVGLAGSSALVIAALRAAGFEGSHRDLAEAALDVEHGIGIVAGLQDRLIQAYEAPLLMDFATDEIDVVRPAQPLWVFVVWDVATAAPSGDYHAALRARMNEVGDVMAALGDLARAAAPLLAAGDARGLGTLVNESFELRRRLGPLPAGQADLVAAVRSLGLPGTSPGSGGSAAGVVDDPAPARILDRLGLPYVIGGI